MRDVGQDILTSLFAFLELLVGLDEVLVDLADVTRLLLDLTSERLGVPSYLTLLSYEGDDEGDLRENNCRHGNTYVCGEAAEIRLACNDRQVEKIYEEAVVERDHDRACHLVRIEEQTLQYHDEHDDDAVDKREHVGGHKAEAVVSDEVDHEDHKCSRIYQMSVVFEPAVRLDLR